MVPRGPEYSGRQEGDMAELAPQVVCVGEVLIEFVRGGDGRFGIASGGDAFNASIWRGQGPARRWRPQSGTIPSRMRWWRWRRPKAWPVI
jgi:hypothetical protein